MHPCKTILLTQLYPLSTQIPSLYPQSFPSSSCRSLPPVFSWIIFLRTRRFFLVCLREPRKFFLEFSLTCLSNYSLISSWISAKLGSALPQCMLYLSYCFQPKEHTWMCLWKVITLQVDFFYNLDPQQMICINFQLHNLYWRIIL